MSDPQAKKPQSDHPQEDDFALDMPLEHDGPGPHDISGPVDELQPLDASAIDASSDEFHFNGPVEELDFSEPSHFAFPSEQPGAAEAASDSSAEIGSGVESLFGTGEAVPHEAEMGGEGAAEPAVSDSAEEAKAKPKPKPKRELPGWVRTVEWTGVGLLAIASLAGLYVAIFFLADGPDTVSLALNIACPLMLALIPYSLWRSSSRWTKPAASAIYTLLLALSVAALIGGTWIQGLELSSYQWQFSKARVAAGKALAATNPAGNASRTK